jgi:hypothetical protein
MVLLQRDVKPYIINQVQTKSGVLCAHLLHVFKCVIFLIHSIIFIFTNEKVAFRVTVVPLVFKVDFSSTDVLEKGGKVLILSKNGAKVLNFGNFVHHY